MSANKLLCVLLLENNADDALIIQHELKDVATVQVAGSGQTFRQMLHRKWDVILVDLALPDIDGKDAIKLVKEQYRRTPVIIVTGSVDAREADEACKAGASRFFLKSINGVPGLERAVVTAHEVALLEEQSVRDNRLEILGHTTIGFTHDLNNLLQVFVGGPDILRKLLLNYLKPLPEEIDRVLSAMESSGRRGADMSKQISTFIRGSNGNGYKAVTAEYVLTELGGLLRDSFPKNIHISLHTVPGTSLMLCDAGQIIQVLLNLCVNARDAMPHGGDLRITAQNTTLHESPLDGDYVVIQVRDTGPGIPGHIAPRIFEPFFTTKPIGKGTGLGLSMAQKIVKEHRGEIDVRTGTAGTTFFVYVPVATPETHEQAMSRAEEFNGQGRTVLVVDDEAHMRMLIEMFLRDANYQTLVAGSGMEALSVFRSNSNIELLLTDCAMPLMSGQELAEVLRAQSYTLPIVFLTGATDTDKFDPSPEAILRKPFSRDLLLRTLNELLKTKTPLDLAVEPGENSA